MDRRRGRTAGLPVVVPDDCGMAGWGVLLGQVGRCWVGVVYVVGRRVVDAGDLRDGGAVGAVGGERCRRCLADRGGLTHEWAGWLGAQGEGGGFAGVDEESAGRVVGVHV